MLVESAPSRVVTVSARAQDYGHIQLDNLMTRRHYDRLLAYADSKLANTLFARELARRLRGSSKFHLSVSSAFQVPSFSRICSPIFCWPPHRAVWWTWRRRPKSGVRSCSRTWWESRISAECHHTHRANSLTYYLAGNLQNDSKVGP